MEHYSKKCKRVGIKYRGVHEYSRNRYIARIRDPIKKGNVTLGVFTNPVSAAYAYDFAARKMRGGHAKTNFFYADNNLLSKSPNLSQLFEPNSPRLPGFCSDSAFTNSSNQPHLQLASNDSSLSLFPPSSISSSEKFSVPSSHQNAKQEPSLTNFPSVFNKPSFLNATTTINTVPIAQTFPNPVESICLQPFSEALDPLSQGSSSSLRPICSNEKKNIVDDIFSESCLLDLGAEISADPSSQGSSCSLTPISSNEKENIVDDFFSVSSLLDLGAEISADPFSQGSSDSLRPISSNENKNIVDDIFSIASLLDLGAEISADPLSSNGEPEELSEISKQNNFLFNTDSIDSELSNSLDCHFDVPYCIDSHDLLTSDNHDQKDVNYQYWQE
ncbi:hypothetical protein SUGI_0097690 [Cryptomeria japonica]|nr:hypothetical protein SUGI_0097690 [Cryptomeria japonica]